MAVHVRAHRTRDFRRQRSEIVLVHRTLMLHFIGDAGNCADVASMGLCYDWDPMDYIYFAQPNESGELVTTINCIECGCDGTPIHVTEGQIATDENSREEFDFGEMQRTTTNSHPQGLAYRRFREFVNPYRRRRHV